MSNQARPSDSSRVFFVVVFVFLFVCLFQKDKDLSEHHKAFIGGEGKNPQGIGKHYNGNSKSCVCNAVSCVRMTF